jgi:hypothetical protein
MTTKNELQSFEEEFFKRIREHDAWKNISGDWNFPWSDKIIERNTDNWDWTELCGNQSICWNEEILEKFKSRIDWNALSGSLFNSNRRGWTSNRPELNIIKKFESYWNWHLLSKNLESTPVNILEQYVDKWDWKELIDNSNINWSFELFEKFKRYIPVSDFDTLKSSALWKNLVEIEQQIIAGRILSEK